ncbi:alpha/beta hydrolase family protein [Kordiimonas lipolytica]|uniref:Alpha/beta hydrolase family protein n=1 Tax=Kordiimonas lipolytica TaxID=1662421 RepID=A0ABV8U8D7_9PROT|nr:alpha/beta fold hydrolase [Kordiimonas lipolytica]
MYKMMMNAVAAVLLLWAVVPAAAMQTMDDITGAWQGDMQVPDGPTFRIGLEVFRKADGQMGANVASLDQGVRYMSVSRLTYLNGRITVVLASADVSISGLLEEDGKSIAAVFNQGNSRFDLRLRKVAALQEALRPQTPTAEVGYASSEVRVENQADNVWLAGTVTVPAKAGRHPAVLLISGSGPNQRDSYFFGHRPFLVLADYLSRRGFVVLRMDKRGVLKSSGDYQKAGIDNFHRDTAAALGFLMNQPYVARENIHLIGHSEGSMVAAMVGRTSPIKSIVSLAGPGLPVREVLIQQDQKVAAMKGATEEELAILRDFSERFYDTVLAVNGAGARATALQALYESLSARAAETVTKWGGSKGTLNVGFASNDTFRALLETNPLDYWADVRAPVLVLGGGKDTLVPAKQNVMGIANALRSHSVAVETAIFADANHMFQSANTGLTEEYAALDETIRPDVLSRIAEWLCEKSPCGGMITE